MAKKTAPPSTPRRRTAAAPRRSTDAITRSTPDDLEAAGPADLILSHDDIAQEAYRRFLDRGGSGGQELDDWLDAERELTKRRNGG